jgi:streptogramin lyase
MFLLTDQERADVLAYLAGNFGPGAKPRVVRTTQSVPLDEGALAKAEFIEYYLKGGSEPVPPGGAPGANGLSHYRTLFTMQLDNDGHVWGVDRGVPNRLVELDPRTGVQKDFVMPDPVAGVHEILIDRSGMIWIPEFDGVPARREYRLVQFNPKTEKWKLIKADPDHIINDSATGMLGIGLDSKGNIYMNWIADGYVSRWERSTGKITFYGVPTPSAQPYGLDVDKNDNLWVAVSSDGKIAKFDTTSKGWTLFVPPTYPAYVRRGVGGSSVDSNEGVWFGVYAAGKRPGTLNMINQVTGRVTQWTIPFQDAQPYGVSVGPHDIVWFPSQGTPDNPAVLGRFDPQTQTFTFYPKPQFIADSPKLQFATNGSVWYAPRFGAPAGNSGFGVLYPDKDKITSLAALPQNGAPGYAYEIPAPATKTQ